MSMCEGILEVDQGHVTALKPLVLPFRQPLFHFDILHFGKYQARYQVLGSPRFEISDRATCF